MLRHPARGEDDGHAEQERATVASEHGGAEMLPVIHFSQRDTNAQKHGGALARASRAMPGMREAPAEKPTTLCQGPGGARRRRSFPVIQVPGPDGLWEQAGKPDWPRCWCEAQKEILTPVIGRGGPEPPTFSSPEGKFGMTCCSVPGGDGFVVRPNRPAGGALRLDHTQRRQVVTTIEVSSRNLPSPTSSIGRGLWKSCCSWSRTVGVKSLLEDPHGFLPLEAVSSAVQSNETKEDDGMKLSLQTYMAYSIGCAVVSAVILAVVASVASKDTTHTWLLVFFGWVIGWLSATIARAVYPPPNSRRKVGV